MAAEYATTYVERDVRQILSVADLNSFSTFLALAAGRTGQELHLSALGADPGVTHPTVRSWISVLEASFLVFRTPRSLRSVRKRAVKDRRSTSSTPASLAICWRSGTRINSGPIPSGAPSSRVGSPARSEREDAEAIEAAILNDQATVLAPLLAPLGREGKLTYVADRHLLVVRGCNGAYVAGFPVETATIEQTVRDLVLGYAVDR